MEGRPPRLVLLGAPGAGKSTIGSRISKAYGAVLIRPGELLQAEVAARSALGLRIKAAVDTGEVVPEQLMVELLQAKLSEPACRQQGWILDGFPRVASQAAALLEGGILPERVILLEASSAILEGRCLRRMIDPETGESYDMQHNPPTDPEVRQRLCKVPDDSRPSSVQARIAAHERHSNEVFRTFVNNVVSTFNYQIAKALNITPHAVNAEPSCEEVWCDVRQVIEGEAAPPAALASPSISSSVVIAKEAVIGFDTLPPSALLLTGALLAQQDGETVQAVQLFLQDDRAFQQLLAWDSQAARRVAAAALKKLQSMGQLDGALPAVQAVVKEACFWMLACEYMCQRPRAAPQGDAHPLVINGPSGVGKGTLINRLVQDFPQKFGFSVSHTTRGPRPGEEDGKHYHFSSHEAMEAMISEGQFLESAHVHGNIYGTSKAAVQKVVEQGKICVLDIDVQGAESVKAANIGAQYVFIKPPSMQELEDRLRGRATESEEKILKRLANAQGEMAYADKPDFYDKIIVNDNLENAYICLVNYLGLSLST